MREWHQDEEASKEAERRSVCWIKRERERERERERANREAAARDEEEQKKEKRREREGGEREEEKKGDFGKAESQNMRSPRSSRLEAAVRLILFFKRARARAF